MSRRRCGKQREQKPPGEHGREAGQHSAWGACGVPAPGMSALCPCARGSLVLLCWSTALAERDLEVWGKEMKQAQEHPGLVKHHPPPLHQHLMPSSSGYLWHQTCSHLPVRAQRNGGEVAGRPSYCFLQRPAHLLCFLKGRGEFVPFWPELFRFVRAVRSLFPLDLVIRRRWPPPAKQSLCAEHRRRVSLR